MLFGFKERKRIKNLVKESIEEINKNVYDDELWKGRFIMEIADLKLRRYEDWSGYAAILKVKLLDKQTGLSKYEYVRYSDVFLKSHIWEKMNNFIVMDVNVWKENPKPDRKTSIDYRGK